MTYSITPEFYCEVVDQLLAQISRKSYYSGSFEFDFKSVKCRMVLSAIVCWRDESMPEGVAHVVKDVVPVWWEMHTEVDGVERLNDFSFNELREYIKER